MRVGPFGYDCTWQRTTTCLILFDRINNHQRHFVPLFILHPWVWFGRIVLGIVFFATTRGFRLGSFKPPGARLQNWCGKSSFVGATLGKYNLIILHWYGCFFFALCVKFCRVIRMFYVSGVHCCLPHPSAIPQNVCGLCCLFFFGTCHERQICFM